MNTSSSCPGRYPLPLATLLFSIFLSAVLTDSFAIDLETMPPADAPGRLVDIGSHRLYIDCRGQGSPTIVFENGLGGLHYEWSASAHQLRKSQRVCLYDRAGYGYSEAGPLPRHVVRITRELHALLERAGESGPFLLVGHSFGGYVVQMFARSFPELTAGVVLVDASHPEQVERYLAPPLRINTAPSRRGRIVRIRAPRLPANYPQAFASQAMNSMLHPRMRFAVTEEYFEFRASAAAVRRAPIFPQVPTLILTRGKQSWPATEPGFAAEQLWVQLQDELARLSRVSAHVVALDSGHHVQLDQPQLVVDAVQLVSGTAQQLAHREMLRQQPDQPPQVGSATSLATTIESETLLHRYLWLSFDGAHWRSDSLHRSITMHPSFARLGDTSMRAARMNFHQQLSAMNPVGSFSIPGTPTAP